MTSSSSFNVIVPLFSGVRSTWILNKETGEEPATSYSKSYTERALLSSYYHPTILLQISSMLFELQAPDMNGATVCSKYSEIAA